MYTRVSEYVLYMRLHKSEYEFFMHMFYTYVCVKGDDAEKYSLQRLSIVSRLGHGLFRMSAQTHIADILCMIISHFMCVCVSE